MDFFLLVSVCVVTLIASRWPGSRDSVCVQYFFLPVSRATHSHCNHLIKRSLYMFCSWCYWEEYPVCKSREQRVPEYQKALYSRALCSRMHCGSTLTAVVTYGLLNDLCSPFSSNELTSLVQHLEKWKPVLTHNSSTDKTCSKPPVTKL